jgi:hypothetical protein
MDHNCQECSELLNAYNDATSAHLSAAIELVGSMRVDDQDAWEVLSQKEATAYYKTLELRRAIRQHEIAAHSSMPTEFDAAVGER